jgi:hypothetical protein
VRGTDLFDDRRSSISRLEREDPVVERLDPEKVLGHGAGVPQRASPSNLDASPPS